MSKKNKISLLVATIILSIFVSAFAFTVDTSVANAAEGAANVGYGYEATATEVVLMANIVYQEARGESTAGQIAVAEVIMNRVVSPLYPNTITEVVSQSGQFSSYASASTMTEEETSQDMITLCLSVINGQASVLNNYSVLAFKRNDGSQSFYGNSLYQVIDNHAFYSAV